MATRSRGLEDVLHFFIPEDEQRRARAARRSEDARSAGLDSDGSSARGSHAEGDADSGRRPSKVGRWVLAADPRRPLSAALAVDLVTALQRNGAPSEILSATPPPLPWRDSRAVSWTRVASPHAARSALGDRRQGGTRLLALAPQALPEWLPALGPSVCTDGLLLAVDASPRSLDAMRSALQEVSRRAGDASAIPWIGAIAMGAADPEIGRRALRQAAELTRGILGRDLRKLGGFPHDRASFRSLLQGQPVFEVDSNAASARCLRRIALALEARVAQRA
ncbi:MAG: MinD/ParA family protein [Myxococcota bacterium]